MKIDDNSITFSVCRVTITLAKGLVDRKYFQDIHNSISKKVDNTFLFKENSMPVLLIQIKNEEIFLTSGRMTCQIKHVDKFLNVIEDIINISPI